MCAFNDETAIAVLAGMREHGLTAPADLAVIGVDDIPTARLAAPPLTTVGVDLHQAGRGRAEMIVASLAGREPHLAAAQRRVEGHRALVRLSRSPGLRQAEIGREV